MAAEGKKRTAENPRKIGGFGVPGAIRTPGLPLRRRLLYPAELREHIFTFQGMPLIWDSAFAHLGGGRSILLSYGDRCMGLPHGMHGWGGGKGGGGRGRADEKQAGLTKGLTI